MCIRDRISDFQGNLGGPTKRAIAWSFFGPIDLNSFPNVSYGLYLGETGSFLYRLVDIRAEILA